MKKISIAGATGYTGIELLRLLVNHPEVEIATLTAESHAGKNIAAVAPSLKGWVDQTLIKLSPKVAEGCDVLFLALPHTTSMEHVPELLQHDATPEALAEKMLVQLDKARREPEYLARFADLHRQLSKGADERAADAVARWFN